MTPNNSSDPPRLLNYLTAPHVLVWSAAVASSSLPGVFEANRLMVKDADGTVRYESAERAAFSDGSMEQGKEYKTCAVGLYTHVVVRYVPFSKHDTLNHCFLLLSSGFFFLS